MPKSLRQEKRKKVSVQRHHGISTHPFNLEANTGREPPQL